MKRDRRKMINGEQIYRRKKKGEDKIMFMSSFKRIEKNDYGV